MSTPGIVQSRNIRSSYFSTITLIAESISEIKRAIIAIARMILTAIFQMISTGEVWNPTDLFKGNSGRYEGMIT